MYISAGWAIFFNIVGGVLTIVVVGVARCAKRRCMRRRFKRIFGTRVDRYLLVYSGFVLRSEFRSYVPEIPKELLSYPLAKPQDSGIRISAEKTASACEIRAASYVGPTLAKELGIPTNFIDDNSIRDRLDIDFVSFGALANDKTRDIFQNEANDLVEYDHSKRFFVWKGSREKLFEPRLDGLHDYGIVLKIHPNQFPNRIWIACAGIGETGTSASAYFLATKWKEIEREVKGSGKFVCLVEVEKGKDESAVKLFVRQTEQSGGDSQPPRACNRGIYSWLKAVKTLKR